MALLAYLMPVSQAASWAALYAYGTPSAPFVASFYLLWAVKNRLMGPLWSDLGVFTFGAVYAAFKFSSSPWVKAAPAMLVALQFAAVAVKAVPAPSEKVATRLKKPTQWAVIFKIYLLVSTVYWLTVAVMLARE